MYNNKYLKYKKAYLELVGGAEEKKKKILSDMLEIGIDEDLARQALEHVSSLDAAIEWVSDLPEVDAAPEWTCPACTVDNMYDASACSTCFAPRPDGKQKEAVEQKCKKCEVGKIHPVSKRCDNCFIFHSHHVYDFNEADKKISDNIVDMYRIETLEDLQKKDEDHIESSIKKGTKLKAIRKSGYAIIKSNLEMYNYNRNINVRGDGLCGFRSIIVFLLNNYRGSASYRLRTFLTQAEVPQNLIINVLEGIDIIKNIRDTQNFIKKKDSTLRSIFINYIEPFIYKNCFQGDEIHEHVESPYNILVAQGYIKTDLLAVIVFLLGFKEFKILRSEKDETTSEELEATGSTVTDNTNQICHVREQVFTFENNQFLKTPFYIFKIKKKDLTGIIEIYTYDGNHYTSVHPGDDVFDNRDAEEAKADAAGEAGREAAEEAAEEAAAAAAKKAVEEKVAAEAKKAQAEAAAKKAAEEKVAAAAKKAAEEKVAAEAKKAQAEAARTAEAPDNLAKKYSKKLIQSAHNSGKESLERLLNILCND